MVRVPVAMATLATIILSGVALLHIADYISSHTYVVSDSDFRFGAGLSSWFPARAAASIAREQLPGNVFEHYALGGYVARSLGPRYPDFIDGRDVNPDLVLEQHDLYRENPDSQLWQSEADRWNLNVLIIATSGFRGLKKMDPLAFCESAMWRAVYMDDVSLVFMRNTPTNRPWIDRFQIDCQTQLLSPPNAASRPMLYDFYFNSGALFSELHRDRESEAFLRRASTFYPDDPNAHTLLASSYWRERRYHEAEQEYLASLALNEDCPVRYSLGLLYVVEGRRVESVEAIEHAAKESVFPCDMYMTLGKLQLSLNHPEQALAAFDAAEKNSPYRYGSESLAPELYAEIAEGSSEADRLLGRLAPTGSNPENSLGCEPLEQACCPLRSRGADVRC